MKFRTRLFFICVTVAILSLAVSAGLASSTLRRQQVERIEASLLAQSRLVAELLSRRGPFVDGIDVDDEADSLGEHVAARVTLIDQTGHVMGDSAEDNEGLAAMDNHGSRPEVVSAREQGVGVIQRYSTTVDERLLYAAVQVDHPSIAVVRLAMPLTAVQDQLDAVTRATGLGVVVALAGALIIAWIFSSTFGRRVASIASRAEQYALGDLSPSGSDFDTDEPADELGTVSKALDHTVKELGRRLQELSGQQKRTRAILQGMVEGVLVIDDTGRVRNANESVKQMLGIGDDPIDRPYIELIRHPEVTRLIAEAVAGRATAGEEVNLNTDPPKVFLVNARAFAANDDRGVALVFHDVTEFRRADQVRQDFVANVSHELRTPLTAIRGSVEALVEQISGESDRRFVTMIARNSARMERLVDDLLRLARLDAGQEALDLAECSVLSLFTAVTSELSLLIDAKKKQVKSSLADDCGVVWADPLKLHDAVRNLVENAVNYAPEGTTIDLAATVDQDVARLTVADRGPGIPATDLVRVFERFYRVDTARDRGPGGTGLGLAIVKHLIGLHGGSVTAAQRAGGGTIFTIELPQETGSDGGSGGMTNQNPTI